MTGVLDGRVILVTGAGQGLGRAFAQRLSADGATVAVADIDEASAVSVAAELPGRGLAVEVDVADEDAVREAVDAVVAELGGLDVLINNASLFSTLVMKDVGDITVADWDRVMAVNVRGSFLCAREAVPVMRRAGRGKIVNISSATVFLGRPRYLHYVTSKAAIIGMTRALASELGPVGITVNAVTPGSTETEVPRETVTPEQAERIVGGQALRRRETAADLVGTIAFLAGPDSDFITGQTINVDGGASYH